MKQIIYLLGFVSLAISTSVFALEPVIDLAEIAKTAELIEEANNQLQQLKDLSNINADQYNFLQKNLNGNYGYGNLLNEDSDLNQKQWSNDSWTDVLSESSSGNAAAFADAQKTYDKLYPVVKPDQIAATRSKDNLTRTHYEQSSEISRATLAASSYGYDQINQHIKNVHDILEKLDSQTTEKAAIDLNARLNAEVAFILLEQLRQQVMQNQNIATQTQGEVNGMSDASKFMQMNSQ
ncbi:MAG: hypothetical protein EPO11_02415 [Gammaproteobacteria bacterium]|nr:MAG: hypothetical protein EPO11_02415 [Gammaproteobacteria bacterium]